jgi:hydroxymethylbilane synthase
VLAERALSRALAGSCQVPLGGFAEILDGKLRLRGFVASPDGQQMLRAEALGDIADPEALGNQVAAALCAQGADVILAALNG